MIRKQDLVDLESCKMTEIHHQMTKMEYLVIVSL